EARAAGDRHLNYYLALAQRAEPELRGHEQIRWLDRLEREDDNLRTALAWSDPGQAPEPAVRVAGMLAGVSRPRGHIRHGPRGQGGGAGGSGSHSGGGVDPVDGSEAPRRGRGVGLPPERLWAGRPVL